SVSGAEYEIVAMNRAQEVRQVPRIMREVGVHFKQDVVLPLQSPSEAGEIRGAQAHLLRSPKNVDPRVHRDDLLDDGCRSIWRTVVDDEDLEPAISAQDRLDQTRDVLALIVRGNDDQRALNRRDSSSFWTCRGVRRVRVIT